MKTLTCTCCGADITAPQFHNGKPYGYTCILKVAPEQKQVKTVYVAAEMVKSVNVAGRYQDVTVKVDGKAYRKLIPVASLLNAYYEQNGEVFVNLKAF